MKIIDLIDQENLEIDRRRLREHDSHKYIQCGCEKCVFNNDGCCKKGMVIIDTFGYCSLMIPR